MDLRTVVTDARDFLALLSDEQRTVAMLPIGDESERRTWFYWPAPRRGLPLAQMSGVQAKATHNLIADVLSRVGVAKVHAIIGLEQVLDEIEERQGSRRGLPRDAGLYYMTIFGSPSEEAPWSLRFEGHHVSIHVAFSAGEIACTPSFLGANPAMVGRGDRVITRPLGEEEDAARDLLESLSEQAVVSTDAPDDILTMNLPKLDELPNGAGARASEFSRAQLELMEQLIAVYVERMRPEVAGVEIDRLRVAGLQRSVFAWAGSLERGERHYYRLTGPTFVIEYDNTQDNANHVHAVWRDLERDFGGDVFRAHLAHDHERM